MNVLRIKQAVKLLANFPSFTNILKSSKTQHSFQRNIYQPLYSWQC